jgi:PIN domain nuclease of toxin-antitoxin system
MTYVIDTHPLVWFLDGSPRLSQTAGDALRDPTAQVVIPAIVLAEIKFLHGRGRIRVDLPSLLGHVTASSNLRIHPLDETVAERLPTTLNIHDGLIVATALTLRDVLSETVAVITKDAEIVASGLVAVIW